MPFAVCEFRSMCAPLWTSAVAISNVPLKHARCIGRIPCSAALDRSFGSNWLAMSHAFSSFLGLDITNQAEPAFDPRRPEVDESPGGARGDGSHSRCLPSCWEDWAH